LAAVNTRAFALIALIMIPMRFTGLVALIAAVRDMARRDVHPLVCSLLMNALVIPFTPQSTLREPFGDAALYRGAGGRRHPVGAYRKSRRALNYSLLWIATLCWRSTSHSCRLEGLLYATKENSSLIPNPQSKHEINRYRSTYNERENIVLLVPELLALPAGVHVLVVDDNSPDRPASSPKRCRPRIRACLCAPARQDGLGTAYIAGSSSSGGRVGLHPHDDADYSHHRVTFPQ